MRKIFLLATLILTVFFSTAQTSDSYILLKPDRVFDGTAMQAGWVVLVKNNIIAAAETVIIIAGILLSRQVL